MIIAICDDEHYYRDLMIHHAQSWAQQYDDIPLTIKTYETAESLYDDWTHGICFDILFLDIQLSHMSGLDLAHAIRRSDPYIPIVFVSAHEHFAASGYEVDAYRFLIKPFTPQAVYTCLDHTRMHLNSKNAFDFYVTRDGINIRLQQRDILVIACSNHHAIFTMQPHDEHYSLRMKGSFDDLIQSLEAPFLIRCHSSYVVNAMYVKSFTRTDIFMANGQKIPISRSHQQSAIAGLLKFSRGGVL